MFPKKKVARFLAKVADKNILMPISNLSAVISVPIKLGLGWSKASFKRIWDDLLNLFMCLQNWR